MSTKRRVTGAGIDVTHVDDGAELGKGLTEALIVGVVLYTLYGTVETVRMRVTRKYYAENACRTDKLPEKNTRKRWDAISSDPRDRACLRAYWVNTD